MTACSRCGYESSQPFRFCPECGTETTSAARELRKTVTVLFSDIVGSTSLGETLDPESLRRVLERYLDEVRAILERHGGTLEKFIGDAVVAIFGVPIAREDDALRALRAAAEIRERLALLNRDFEQELGIRLEVRTGVNTGEVVVGDRRTDGFTASGDTMNVAARLEQAASAEEILIGAQTRALGGDAILVEELEPLELKGKEDPVSAFRLSRVFPDVSPYRRRDDSPLVGRGDELGVLRGAFRRAVEGEQCFLATVAGSAGLGKSRLVREFLASLDESARVLVGRCVAYGEGITFLPLGEALQPVLGPDARAGALALLRGDDRAELVADRVAAALGAGDGGGSGDETFWAFRRLFEALARERPLVLVVDDVHWAEARLLDLLEYVAAFASGAQILLVCVTRPELLEERPTWAVPRDNFGVVTLGPLAEEEALALLAHLNLERELRSEDLRKVVETADGNPLFLEQLLALNTGGESGEELVVPPTIHALLAARLDQLEPGERLVVQCAATEGREFHRGAVLELLPETARVELGQNLLSLARRQFIRPLRAADPGEDAFAFVHALVREAAYSATPKKVRADLHLRLADYLERDSDAAVEIVGQHLAETARYRLELGHDDETTRKIALRGAECLATGGRRALALGDDRAAAKLLERARELVPATDALGARLRLDLGRALAGGGRFEEARIVFDDVRATAVAVGDSALQLHAEVGLVNLRSVTDADIPLQELVATAERAFPVFENLGDEEGLARSWWLVHWARFRAGRYTESVHAAERAVEHARQAGDRRAELQALGAIAMATLVGPTPAAEGLERCDQVVEQADGARLVEAYAARARGCFLGMTGEFERGVEECRRSTEIFEELGLRISAIGVVCELAPVLRQSGQFEAAERELRTAYETLLAIGDIGYVSWVGPLLARALAERGAYAEARDLARRCREETQRDHAFGQIAARHAEAIALLGEGQSVAAEALALEALALVDETDILDIRADLLLVLADVDTVAGRGDEARQRVALAIELYERKGDVVSAARARERA